MAAVGVGSIVDRGARSPPLARARSTSLMVAGPLHAARAVGADERRCRRAASTASGSSRRPCSTPACSPAPRPGPTSRYEYGAGAARAARARAPHRGGLRASRRAAARRPRCSSRCASRRSGASWSAPRRRSRSARTRSAWRPRSRRRCGTSSPDEGLVRDDAHVVDATCTCGTSTRSDYAWLTPEHGAAARDLHARAGAGRAARRPASRRRCSSRPRTPRRDTELMLAGRTTGIRGRRRGRLGRSWTTPRRPSAQLDRSAERAALPRRAPPRARRPARRLPRACRRSGGRSGCSPSAASRSTCRTPGRGTCARRRTSPAALGDLRIVVDHLGKPPLRRRRLGPLAGRAARRSPRTRTRRPRSPASRCPAGRSRPPRCGPAWEVALELFGPGAADVGRRLADDRARRRLPRTPGR